MMSFVNLALCIFDSVEQLKHCQTKGICDDLNSVKRRIRLTILNPAQVGLIETTLFPEFNLTQACLLTQRANTRTELQG